MNKKEIEENIQGLREEHKRLGDAVEDAWFVYSKFVDDLMIIWERHGEDIYRELLPALGKLSAQIERLEERKHDTFNKLESAKANLLSLLNEED